MKMMTRETANKIATTYNEERAEKERKHVEDWVKTYAGIEVQIAAEKGRFNCLVHTPSSVDLDMARKMIEDCGFDTKKRNYNEIEIIWSQGLTKSLTHVILNSRKKKGSKNYEDY